MRVQILVTTNDGDGVVQKLIGTFTLNPGDKVPSISAPTSDGLEVMRGILASDEDIFMRTGYVNVKDAPEAWMRALPYLYNGSRMRAALEE